MRGAEGDAAISELIELFKAGDCFASLAMTTKRFVNTLAGTTCTGLFSFGAQKRRIWYLLLMDERIFGNSTYYIYKKPRKPVLKKLKALFASNEPGEFLGSPNEFIIYGEHGRKVMLGKINEITVAHRIIFSIAFMTGSTLLTLAGKIGFWIIALSVFYLIIISRKRGISFGDGREIFFSVTSQSRVFLKERYLITDASGELLGTIWWKWSLKDPAGLWRCRDKEGRDIFEMRASNARYDSRFELFRCADGAIAGKVSLSRQKIMLRLKGGQEYLSLLFCMVAIAFRPF